MKWGILLVPFTDEKCISTGLSVKLFSGWAPFAANSDNPDLELLIIAGNENYILGVNVAARILKDLVIGLDKEIGK